MCVCARAVHACVCLAICACVRMYVACVCMRASVLACACLRVPGDMCMRACAACVCMRAYVCVRCVCACTRVPWCAAILMSLVNTIIIDSDSSSHWGSREKVFPGANPIRDVVKSQCRELERRAGPAGKVGV